MQYRKKPVVIEAVKLEHTMASIQECYTFMKWYTHTSSKMGQEAWYSHQEKVIESKGITIPTLEGEMLASWGDYIIKGVDGEFYPCKPDIFEKTYEKVGE